MQKEFTSLKEAESFVEDLISENKYVIDIQTHPDDKWVIQWQEHKTYVSLDGIEYPDEVWITKDNQLLQVQDIEPEHCRNILRMLLRQSREVNESLSVLENHIDEDFRDLPGVLQETDESHKYKYH